MGFFSQIIRPKAMSSHELSKLILEHFGGGSTSTGISVNSETAMRLITVYSCVKVLYQSIFQLPCHLMEQSERFVSLPAVDGKSVGITETIKRKATDHPLYSVLHDQANSWMTAPELWGMSAAHESLRGDFVAFKNIVRNQVREIIPVDPNRLIEIKQNSDWSLTYKISDGSGVVKEYPQEKIFHVRGMSLNGFSGLNPIAYARESVGLGLASERFKSRFFGKGLHPGAVITAQNVTKDPQSFANLVNSMKAKYAGLGNTHDLMYLEGGSTITFPPIKLVDQQFLENEKFTQSQIAGLFRVPLILLQAGDNPASYASSEQFMLAFVTHALTPLVVSREKSIYRDILTTEEKKKYYVKFNMAGLLRGDQVARANYYQTMVNIEALCPNEVRSAEDLNAYPGGWEYRTRTSTTKQSDNKDSKDKKSSDSADDSKQKGGK